MTTYTARAPSRGSEAARAVRVNNQDCSSDSTAEERPIAGSSIDIAQPQQWRIHMKMTTGVMGQQLW